MSANDGTRLRDDVALEIFEGKTLAPEASDAPIPGGTNELMHRRWAPIVITVPAEGPAHPTLYRLDRYRTTTTARQRREYPTPATVTQLRESSRSQQMEEVLSAPFVALADLVSLPVRLFIKAPGHTERNRNPAYDRAPSPRGPDYVRLGE